MAGACDRLAFIHLFDRLSRELSLVAPYPTSHLDQLRPDRNALHQLIAFISPFLLQSTSQSDNITYSFYNPLNPIAVDSAL